MPEVNLGVWGRRLTSPCGKELLSQLNRTPTQIARRFQPTKGGEGDVHNAPISQHVQLKACGGETVASPLSVLFRWQRWLRKHVPQAPIMPLP